MDIKKVLVLVILTLLCVPGKSFLGPRTTKIKRRERERKEQPPRQTENDIHKQVYESILASCTNEQNYMCKFDVKVKELQIPMCLPFDLVCDGIPQCPMHDDEHNCPEKCGTYQMRCPNGACATACNNFPECPGLEDELFCAPVCNTGHLRCSDGNCATICDGVPDCNSGADELNCGPGIKCGYGKVYCSDLETCATVCDGEQECYDGADEQNCLPKCDKTQIICSSGNCGRTCDGRPDCFADLLYGVTSDERNCP